MGRIVADDEPAIELRRQALAKGGNYVALERVEEFRSAPFYVYTRPVGLMPMGGGIRRVYYGGVWNCDQTFAEPGWVRVSHAPASGCQDAGAITVEERRGSFRGAEAALRQNAAGANYLEVRASERRGNALSVTARRWICPEAS